MRQTLQEFKRLCDDTVILFNNAGPEEEALVEEFGFAHDVDNREWGINQWKIKQDFVERTVKHFNPDWLVFLDMDEVFDPYLNRAELDKLAAKNFSYRLLVVNMYDTGWSKELSFPTVRIWKPLPHLGFNFAQKAVHGGCAPEWAYHNAVDAPFFLQHFGLQSKTNRDRKITRYKKYDPTGKFLDKAWYEKLNSYKALPFDPLTMHQFVVSEVKETERKEPFLRNHMDEKIYFVIREVDGARIAINERHLDSTLRRGGFHLDETGSEATTTKVAEVPIIEDKLSCSECAFIARSAFGLKAHARKHKKI